MGFSLDMGWILSEFFEIPLRMKVKSGVLGRILVEFFTYFRNSYKILDKLSFWTPKFDYRKRIIEWEKQNTFDWWKINHSRCKNEIPIFIIKSYNIVVNARLQTIIKSAIN